MAPNTLTKTPPPKKAPGLLTETVGCCVCGNQGFEFVSRGRDFEYDSSPREWAYVRCQNCGHHYLRERPGQESLTIVYPPNYGNYSNSAKPSLAFRVKAQMEAVTLRRLARQAGTDPAVFDVGCGDGRLLDGMKAACPGVGRLAGCEISGFAAERAREKGYEISTGSFESLNYSAESFDLIFLIQVLEHLADPPGAIAKIADMLRPGGMIVIETPSTDCWDFRLFRKRYWGGYHYPRHFNLFMRKNAEELLSRNGLEPVSYKVKVQPVHWVWTAHHWLMEIGAPAALYETFNIKNPFWLGLATLLDATQVCLRKKSSNMQIVARKSV